MKRGETKLLSKQLLKGFINLFDNMAKDSLDALLI